MKVSLPGVGVQYVDEPDPRPIQARPGGSSSTPFLTPAQAIAHADARQAATDRAQAAAAQSAKLAADHNAKTVAQTPSPHSLNLKPEQHT